MRYGTVEAMAISHTLLGATPHAVRYSVIGDTNDNESITAAQLLADCVAGPLKDTINQANLAGNAAWVALGQTNMAVSIVNGGQTTNTPSPATVPQGVFDTLGGTRNFRFVAAAGSNAVPGVLEIRFNHSYVR